MNRNRSDYLNAENECLTAIDHFKITSSVKEWLELNESLYSQIIIKPNGLPAIIDCHFDGQRYEGYKNLAIYMKQ
jgi:hypothetical protein